MRTLLSWFHSNVRLTLTTVLCKQTINLSNIAKWWWFSRSVVSDSWDPMDCSLPGSSVHEILQARILEWVAISFSGDLPDPGIEHGSPALQAEALTSEPPHRNIDISFYADKSQLNSLVDCLKISI